MPIDRLTRASLMPPRTVRAGWNCASYWTGSMPASTISGRERQERGSRPGPRDQAAGGGARRLVSYRMPGVSAGGFAHGVRSSLHMTAISLLAGLLLGIVIGAAIGYLFARGRLAAAAEDLNGQLADRFQALSAEALDASTARFLE